MVCGYITYKDRNRKHERKDKVSLAEVVFDKAFDPNIIDSQSLNVQTFFFYYVG